MKHSTVFTVLVSILMGITFCITTEPARQNAGFSGIALLNPEDVIGKNLAGSDANDAYRFTLNQDGSLEYAVNDSLYQGDWAFDKKRPMYRYTFTWIEDGTDKGYIMDFLSR